MKISILAWVSKGRTKTLERSINSFSAKIKNEKLGLSTCVVDSSTDDSGTISKLKLIDELVKKGVDAELIRFALLGEMNGERNNWIDTGSNRNALLLYLVDKVFMSIDDDIVCRWARVKKDTLSYNNKDYDPALISFYHDRADCINELLPEADCSLSELLRAHEQLLDSKCYVSMSGSIGDSGFGSPRPLLMIPSVYEFYDDAIRNRLMKRGVNGPTVSASPLFMGMCVAFNNQECLPPFFPIGRNQDGVFGNTIKTCCPNSLIGHVPFALFHDPQPSREYIQGDVSNINFRISEVMNLLLDSICRITRPQYMVVGELLVDIAKDNDEKFLCTIRELYKQQLEPYKHRLMDIVNRDRFTAPKNWRQDVFNCINNIDEYIRSDNFCVPVDITLEQSRQAVILYGRLLKEWENIYIKSRF